MKFCVLMPTLNAQTYLVEAIESVLGQTERGFSLVVLDGGSTDATVPIVTALRNRDPRISLEILPGLNPTQRLNHWLATSDATFVAMAHADDVSLNDRLAAQLAFMTAHPDVAISGGATYFWLHQKTAMFPPDATAWQAQDQKHLIRMDGPAEAHRYSGLHFYPGGHEEILCRLPFWWCFSIPALILNLGLLRQAGVLFDETLDCCSDWWFYWQARRAGRLANLSRPLISYRHHADSHGNRSLAQIAAESRRIRIRIATEAGFWPHLREAEQQAFLALRVEGDRPTGWEDAAATLAMLDRIAACAADRAPDYAKACEAMVASYKEALPHG